MTTMIVIMGVWSTFNSIPAAWVAVIGTVFGGISLKVTEKWLAKHQEQRTEQETADRRYKELQDRLDKVEAEVDEWRTKFYAQQEHILVLKAMMIGAGLTPPDPK